MSIVRFDPFADLLTNGRWVPAVDIFENGKQELVLKAELPDMKREDIQVVFENNTLTIKGQKKAPADVKEEHYRRIAWSNDRFSTPSAAGWRTDRGKTYIRFGPPDEKEEHPNDRPASEKWRYRLLQGIGANVIVEFRDAGGGDYRMTTDPGAR